MPQIGEKYISILFITIKYHHLLVWDKKIIIE